MDTECQEFESLFEARYCTSPHIARINRAAEDKALPNATASVKALCRQFYGAGMADAFHLIDGQTPMPGVQNHG